MEDMENQNFCHTEICSNMKNKIFLSHWEWKMMKKRFSVFMEDREKCEILSH